MLVAITAKSSKALSTPVLFESRSEEIGQTLVFPGMFGNPLHWQNWAGSVMRIAF